MIKHFHERTKEMRCLIYLAVIAASAAASVINPERAYKDGDRYFYFPGDGDNTLHLVDTQEPIDTAFLNSLTRNPADNAYWLFTRQNPTTPQLLALNDATSVANSNFDFSKETVFTAHGWRGNGNNDMNQLIVEAFLQQGDLNVVVVDWNKLANRNYLTAKAGVAEVGKGLGQFINWLVSLGASYDRVHLVGFSLGGHLVGNAGRETGGKIRRITGHGEVEGGASSLMGRPDRHWNSHSINETQHTVSQQYAVWWSQIQANPVGPYRRVIESFSRQHRSDAVAMGRPLGALDPAGPLWGSDSNKLRSTDAQYVEVIHTNTNTYGYKDPLGDADFYPNGGGTQPGCWLSSCSHGRAYELMASSVKYDHLLSNACATYNDVSKNTCDGVAAHPMGNSVVQKSLSGIFRCDTDRKYPF